MSRSLLTLALLGWALLLADAGPGLGDADGLAPDTQSTAPGVPGDAADDPPDALTALAGTSPSTPASRQLPRPLGGTAFDRRLHSDHPARAPPAPRSA